jgi:hypothetical protein
LDRLKNCVAALKDARRNMQNEAEHCVVATLDDAIAELERCAAEDNPTEQTVAQAARKALAVLGEVVAGLNGIAELIKIFGGR